jgi:hypothetical protein
MPDPAAVIVRPSMSTCLAVGDRLVLERITENRRMPEAFRGSDW